MKSEMADKSPEPTPVILLGLGDAGALMQHSIQKQERGNPHPAERLEILGRGRFEIHRRSSQRDDLYLEPNKNSQCPAGNSRRGTGIVVYQNRLRRFSVTLTTMIVLSVVIVAAVIQRLDHTEQSMLFSIRSGGEIQVRKDARIAGSAER